MISIATHHLKPPAHMPTYIWSVKDDSGSRGSHCCCSVRLRTEAYTEDAKRTRARSSYQVIVLGCFLRESDLDLQILVISMFQAKTNIVRAIEVGFLFEIGSGDSGHVTARVIK